MVNNTKQTMQQLADLKGKLSALSKSANPQGMFSAMCAQNPTLKQVSDLINAQYNGNGEQAFYAVARQKGMNDQQINEFLQALKQQLL